MATLQIEANRRNAQKSTGPRTPDGKTASSLNSLRHSLRARTVVLPGENHLEFDQLCADLEAEWLNTKDKIPVLDWLRREQSRMERAYARARRKLERLQASRRHQVHPPEEVAQEPLPVAAPELHCVVSPDPRTAGRSRPNSK